MIVSCLAPPTARAARIRAFFFVALLMPASGLAQPQPQPPYYSVQLMGLSSEQNALAELQQLKDQPFARAEQRDKFWLVRVGVYEEPDPARKDRDGFREKGLPNARVVKISRPVTWLLPDGTKLAPQGGAAAAEPPAAARVVPAPAAPVAPAPAAAAAEPAAPPAPEAAPTPEPPPIRVENAGGATDWGQTLVSLQHLGFLDGFTLEGDRGKRELYFPLPPGVAVARAQLVFDIEFGELLIPASSIQFRVNGSIRRAVARGESGAVKRVEIPLTARDLEIDFVKVDLDYTLFLNQDVCFSRHLAGAYARIAPGSGLAVVASDALPRTVRAAWSLLPREVSVAARLAELTPAEFQGLLQLATVLHRDGYDVKLEPLPDNGPTTAHIVVAPAERYVRGTGEELEGAANLRLVRSPGPPRADGKTRDDRAFILLDSTRPLPAADMLRLPWRGAAGARLLDVAAAAEWPQPPDPDDAVRLTGLGFADSEREFTFRADWHIALPFGPLGNARRPARAALELYGPKLTDIRGPTIVSAYFNDRLVYSAALKNGGEKEVLDFELPLVQLRARNNLKIVAQRDEYADDCKLVQAAYPLSISPHSVLETKGLNETPATFAELIPHQRALELYVAKDALGAAERVIPLLVGLGDHFWPDVPPPELRLFDPGADVKPTGPFFVIGNAKWDPRAFVHFDQGRVRVRSNATGEPLLLLDFASDASQTVLQMVEERGHGGAWLKTTGGFINVPGKRMLLEDENVALLGPRGVQMALRVGGARDYRVDYPDAKGWFSATGKWRTVLFVIAWLLVAALLLYLYLKTRRHRGT
jgi:hypothetical protein